MPPTELTDDAAAAASAGEPAGLTTVYEVLAPKVIGYLRAHGVEDPEAMTNDVFLQLLPRLPEITGGAEGIRRLAFTIARFRLVDDVRARGRRGVAVPYDSSRDRRTVPSAEEDAAQTRSLSGVLAVLDTLPADQREVVTLRFVADLSLHQVATVMGRSVGAVKQLQRRGLGAVRSAIEEGRVTL